jgi:class 3 adenylate cyclase
MSGLGNPATPSEARALGEALEKPELTQLWEQSRPEELKGIVEERECAWIWPWFPGVRISKVVLNYRWEDEQPRDKRDKSIVAAIESWPEGERDAHLRRRTDGPDQWGDQVRLVSAHQGDADKRTLVLSPARYLNYVAVHSRLDKPELRPLREEVFENSLHGIHKFLRLPSNFAIHMAVVSGDTRKMALLRQRQGTPHYPGFWEVGVGEFMHGINCPEEEKPFPHCNEEWIPELELYLRQTVREELGDKVFKRAKADDFRLFGFAAEYRTLGPKLLVVYFSDAPVAELREGSEHPQTRDRVMRSDAIELTAVGVKEAITNTGRYPGWTPVSRLALMLALFGKDAGDKEREHCMRKLRHLPGPSLRTDSKRQVLLDEYIKSRDRLTQDKRDLTFLSADVEHSTKMNEGEDALVVEHAFAEYMKFLEDIFRRHRKWKIAWTPDGVMVAFLSPDDAVGAAQELLSQLAGFNANKHRLQSKFHVRCGAHSGEVTIPDATPLEKVKAKVIDLAGHMQKSASPDSLWISEDTYRGLGQPKGFRAGNTLVDGHNVYVWRQAPPESA